MITARNPIVVESDDVDDPGVVIELKLRLVLYLAQALDADAARVIYDLYFSRYGASVTHYRSTASGNLLDAWTPATRARFEDVELPRLCEKLDWGYVFGSDTARDARLLLFHGARPASEAGRASIVRFDFEWDFDPRELLWLAREVVERVDCVGGTAGFVLAEGDAMPSIDEPYPMYAYAMRYWGAEAQSLDDYVNIALDGLPCVAWLTILGRPWQELAGEAAVRRAREVAHASYDVAGHVLIQVEERPRLMDRNRGESLGDYPAAARSLLTCQVDEPGAFADEPWDEEATRRYLHRFTAFEDA